MILDGCSALTCRTTPLACLLVSRGCWVRPGFYPVIRSSRPCEIQAFQEAAAAAADGPALCRRRGRSRRGRRSLSPLNGAQIRSALQFGALAPLSPRCKCVLYRRRARVRLSLSLLEG